MEELHWAGGKAKPGKDMDILYCVQNIRLNIRDKADGTRGGQGTGQLP